MKPFSLYILSLLIPFIASAQTQSSVSGAKINLYGTEEVTRMESSPSSPPLDTDDPGTPGPHGVEVNLILNCDKARDSRACEQAIDAAFGIGESLQIRISKALTQDRS